MDLSAASAGGSPNLLLPGLPGLLLPKTPVPNPASRSPPAPKSSNTPTTATPTSTKSSFFSISSLVNGLGSESKEKQLNGNTKLEDKMKGNPFQGVLYKIRGH